MFLELKCCVPSNLVPNGSARLRTPYAIWNTRGTLETSRIKPVTFGNVCKRSELSIGYAGKLLIGSQLGHLQEIVFDST